LNSLTKSGVFSLKAGVSAQIIIVFCMHFGQGGAHVPDAGALSQLSMPVSLASEHGGTYSFAGIVQGSGRHFRSLAVFSAEAALEVGSSRLDPGLYFADTLDEPKMVVVASTRDLQAAERPRMLETF